MKHFIFLLLLVFYASAFALAQDDLEGIVVYGVSGKVKYAPSAEAKFEKLTAGTELSSEGRLKLKSGSRVDIYYDELVAQQEKPGVFDVAALIEDVELFQELEWADIFGEAIEAAMHPYFVASAERSGFARGGPIKPPPKDEVDGHGNRDYNLLVVQPLGGKVAVPIVTFQWKLRERNKALKNFKFTLLTIDGEVAFEKEVKARKFTLTSDDFQLEPGKSYRWKVSSTDNAELTSAEITFDCVSKSERRAVLKDLTSGEMYLNAGPAARLLMEAALLDNQEYLARAYQQYTTARKSFKKNQLVKAMYNAFLWKYNILN